MTADAIILAVMHALHDEPPEVQAKVRRAIREWREIYQGGNAMKTIIERKGIR